ncbi:MAG TPA: helix-hairpin-helix domain-containing protein [Geobacteraceae bacterium]|nr:helix-hairpin-helix domain-containing protein [Geobacteraceae bacterium]
MILHDGDVLELRSADEQHVDITIKKMRAKEMIVLGIPLNPNRLGVDDWDCLPGIGPALASRIVQDRQNNGDFKSVKDLQRVPGIGEKKYRQLAAYF